MIKQVVSTQVLSLRYKGNQKNKLDTDDIITLVEKLGDPLHLPLNSERMQKLTENYVGSNAKIVGAMGKPLPVTAEKGLLGTLESFRKGSIASDSKANS